MSLSRMQDFCTKAKFSISLFRLITLLGAYLKKSINLPHFAVIVCVCLRVCFVRVRV